MENSKKERSPLSDEEDDEAKRTLFIANLNECVTEEVLYELFLQAGPIESVSIPKDKESKRQKTFGFVTYLHLCTIPYALELYEGIKLFNQRLIIKNRNPTLNVSSRTSSIDNRAPYSRTLPSYERSSNPESGPNLNLQNSFRNVDILSRLGANLMVGLDQPTMQTNHEILNSRQKREKHKDIFGFRDKPYNKPDNRFDNRKNRDYHRQNRNSQQRRQR